MIKLNVQMEELRKAIDVIYVYDKAYPEEHKVYYLCYFKESKEFKWVANAINGTAIYKLNTMNIIEGEEEIEGNTNCLSVINAKELQAILSAYTGLKQTEVEEVYFEVGGNRTALVVEEKPKEGITSLKSTQQRYNLSYAKQGKDINKVLEKLQGVTEDTTAIVYNSKDYLQYIDILLPTIQTENRDTPYSRIYVNKEWIYTKPTIYTAVLKNSLPEELTGYMLSVTNSLCISKSLRDKEDFRFYKETNEVQGTVLLYYSTDTIELQIKAPMIKKNLDVLVYKDKPEVYVKLNKAYMVELYKRISILNSDEGQVGITFDFEAQTGSCVGNMVTQATTLDIPILESQANDRGIIKVELNINLLKKMLLQSKEVTDLYFCINFVQTGYISICMTDSIEKENRGWQTYLPSIVMKR